jgi:hypothetical protein
MDATLGKPRFPPAFPATALNANHEAVATGEARLLSAFVLPTFWPQSKWPEGTPLETITMVRGRGHDYPVTEFRACRCLTGEEHFHFSTPDA